MSLIIRYLYGLQESPLKQDIKWETNLPRIRSGSVFSVIKSQGGIRIHQAGFIDVMPTKYQANVAVKVEFPTATTFLEDSKDDSLGTQNKHLGLVMSLMYLARFTRPDIPMPITYLSTMSAAPTQSDYASMRLPSPCSDNVEWSHVVKLYLPAYPMFS